MALVAILFLSSCTDKGSYESAVEGFEPRYCYKSLGGITCFGTPYHRDERRLVNYFGPAPNRYEKPMLAPETELAPPTQQVKHWVKDPEPIVSLVQQENLKHQNFLKKHALGSKESILAETNAPKENNREQSEDTSLVDLLSAPFQFILN